MNNKAIKNNRAVYILALLATAIAVTTIIVVSASYSPTVSLDTNKNSSQPSAATSEPKIKDSASASAGKNSGNAPSSAGASVDPGHSSGDSALSGKDEPVPTVKEIYFILPVENGTCTKDFTEASVVYNKTLGIYTGHMGMDITGAAGAAVLAAYDGKVTAIQSDYLNGTTVVITHENGLKTIYNSIEADENLSVGDSVRQGDAIGVISENNRREYKDGAHLHFEVEEDGVKVSPSKYFVGYEK